jgi:outer membrane immunogenic protein
MKWHLGASIALVVGLASSAFAADNPAPAAAPALKAPPAAPSFSWTGCYAGFLGGGNWGHSEHIATTGNNTGSTITGDFKMNSAIAGATVGCDYQVEKTVIGFENDASWTNQRGIKPDMLPFDTSIVSTTRENWIDTLRGRVGYAVDHFLFYGTAGVAFAGTTVGVTVPGVGTFSDSRPRTGLAMGLGGEWAAWTQSWGTVSFKLEYLHTDFGSKQFINPPVTGPGFTVLSRDVKLTDDILSAGVNVRFNWGGTVISK